jgi:hypothetical protein
MTPEALKQSEAEQAFERFKEAVAQIASVKKKADLKTPKRTKPRKQ